MSHKTGRIRGAILDDSVVQVLKTAEMENEGYLSWAEIVRCKKPRRAEKRGAIMQRTTLVPEDYKSKFLQKSKEQSGCASKDG